MTSAPHLDNWAVEDRPVALSPFRAVTAIARRWRLIATAPLLVATVAVAAALLFQTHRASSRFVPQTSSADMAAISGIAAQFGFSVGAGGGESPDFYVALLGSSEILREAALTEFSVLESYESSDMISGLLLDLLDIQGDTRDERLRVAVDDLRKRVRGSASVKSGLVTVETTTPFPLLSEALNRRVLDLLESFDRERRQGRAQAERKFVETRLREAEQELRVAENAQTAFLTENRRPQGSALLTMELERIQRQITLRQGVYSTLSQAFEQARIEEVRNTPVLTVVDRPEGSARRRYSLVTAAILGLFLGAAGAITLVLTPEYLLARAREWDGSEREAAASHPAHSETEAHV